MVGKLYIVATPIGNLSDMSHRAIETLEKVDVILCEDTRVTGKLLKRYDVENSILSYHQHSNITKKLRILNDLNNGKSLALVTDAGTPGISDPGNELIDFLLEYNSEIEVIPIPGSSAVTAALSVCGFRSDKYVFLGFLPKKKKKRKILMNAKDTGYAVVFFENPKRLLKVMEEIKEIWGGNSRIFIGRELTKLHETHYRGVISEMIEKFGNDDTRGEAVVVVEGTGKSK